MLPLSVTPLEQGQAGAEYGGFNDEEIPPESQTSPSVVAPQQDSHLNLGANYGEAATERPPAQPQQPILPTESSTGAFTTPVAQSAMQVMMTTATPVMPSTSHTFAASATPVSHASARPVLVATAPPVSSVRTPATGSHSVVSRVYAGHAGPSGIRNDPPCRRDAAPLRLAPPPADFRLPKKVLLKWGDVQEAMLATTG